MSAVTLIMNEPDETDGLWALLVGICALLLVSGCLMGPTAKARRDAPLQLKVTLSNTHELLLELGNTSSNALSMVKSSLPWEWRYSLWVKAFEDDAIGSPLDEAFPPADRPIQERTLTIQPGESLEGTIDLTTRFPDLDEVLKRRSVVIFWNYAQDIQGHEGNTLRLYGSAVIPKSGSVAKKYE